MQYLALIHTDEGAWEALSAADRDAIVQRYVAFASEAREAGVMLGGGELEPTHAATTVRVRNGDQLVTDGPYAEVKEALGGYFVLECRHIHEAVDWAARIPSAEHGAVEVRPMHVDSDAGGSGS